MDQEILQFAVQGFFSVVFFWMYAQERKERQELQKQYYEDLRDIAGMRQNFNRVQSVVKDHKIGNGNGG